MYRSEQIREARERLGMTQETLAEEIGVSRQAVSKWEMGASEPSLENLQVLSQVLGVEFANAPGDTPAEIKNPWKGCCLILGCLLLASLLALGAALLPQETPAEDAGAPGTARSAPDAPDQDTPSITGIAFFDAEGRPLRPDLGDGWLHFEAGSQVLMAVGFQDDTTDTVNAVSLFLTPAGSETLSQREQLAVQAVDSGRTIALFPLTMSPDITGHLDVTLECPGAESITETLNVAAEG